MPPSPSLRISPARDIRIEKHKRGRSLEGGLLFKEKDDDLALFREMQNKERDNFLLLPTDDLDDSLSTKFRYFSEVKLGITIPARGESSDLLNGDGEKNDYDWLLTPPDTPLFPSLDDEPPPANIVQRGRPRSQPITISRSTTMEKSYRSSRSSASPNRLSPSPRSGNSTIHASRSSASPHRLSPSPQSSSSTFSLRGRPSSARPTTPTPSNTRCGTPSQRPSTPNKPLSPAPRSSTPTFRRASTGSSSLPSSYGRRAPSPGKASRGISSSPKLQAWQSTLPGFSTEPPPNLRTSLSDRPASHVRGFSPASSRSGGRDSSSKVRRQSMSPTASRSVSSSHSHERDRFSSQSKGSVASSGEDDLDSPQSVVMGMSESPSSRRDAALMSPKVLAFSKRQSARTPIASSAPKRSFDSALRQMDNRKSPQNMFRPLLSSVPTTTFYVGKANSGHRSMVSRNSSVTTGSNTSSEQGASIVHDTEGSDHDQDILTGELQKEASPTAEEEVFMFDKVDEVSEDIGCEDSDFPIKRVGNSHVSTANDAEPRESNHVAQTNATPASDPSYVIADPIEANSCKLMATCSKCGNKFHFVEPMDENVSICPECAEKGEQSAPVTAMFYTQKNMLQNDMSVEDNNLRAALQVEMGINELQELDKNHIHTVNGQEGRTDVKRCHGCLSGECLVQVTDEEGKQHLLHPQIVGQNNQVNSVSERRLLHLNSFPGLKVDASEGAGISLVLKRSSSNKWPVLQGKALSAANVVCGDPSYTRDIVSALKSSVGHRSASASSSVDLDSTKHIEARSQRQGSNAKDMDSLRDNSTARSLSTTSSFVGVPDNRNEASVHVNSSSEQNDDSMNNVGFECFQETSINCEERRRHQENAETISKDFSHITVGVNADCNLDSMDSCRVVDNSELASHSQLQLECTSIAGFLNVEGSVSSGNAEDLSTSARETDLEISIATAESSVIEEDVMVNNGSHGNDGSDPPTHSSSNVRLEETEDGHDSPAVAHLESPNSKGDIGIVHEASATTAMERDLTDQETNHSDNIHSLEEGSAITIEGPRGQRSRSLTLDEATDTILFCSSIIHDLAYRAVTMAVDNEDPLPVEVPEPAVTILSKPDPRSREIHHKPSKRAPKSRRARQRQSEEDAKFATKTENDEKIEHSMTVHDSAVPNKPDSMKPPKLESKCNCTVM